MQTTQESRLGHARVGHGGQIGDELGIVGRDGGHGHRIGAPDERPPVGILPQLEVLLRHQFVADHAPGDEPEAGLVTGVDQLLGRRRMKMDHRLGCQNQRAVAAFGDCQGPIDRSGGRDRLMGARRDAFAAPDAVFLDDFDHARLWREGNRIGRAGANAGQTSDATRGVNGEVQGRSGEEVGPALPASWQDA